MLSIAGTRRKPAARKSCVLNDFNCIGQRSSMPGIIADCRPAVQYDLLAILDKGGESVTELVSEGR